MLMECRVNGEKTSDSAQHGELPCRDTSLCP